MHQLLSRCKRGENSKLLVLRPAIWNYGQEDNIFQNGLLIHFNHSSWSLAFMALIQSQNSLFCCIRINGVGASGESLTMDTVSHSLFIRSTSLIPEGKLLVLLGSALGANMNHQDELLWRRLKRQQLIYSALQSPTSNSWKSFSDFINLLTCSDRLFSVLNVAYVSSAVSARKSTS